MRILVITDVLWRNDNGVGNSYSNIFTDMPEVEIANVCCQEGTSYNTVSKKCFQISEGILIRNLRNKANPAGIIEARREQHDESNTNGSNFMRALRRSRLQVLFWARNCIWKVGRWKSPELRAFIDEFSPDLVFAQLQDKMYLNSLAAYVADYTNKPLVLYVWDDVYSLKQFCLSPLWWIDRLFQRRSIRNLIKRCSILYTISNEQKEEYHKTLGVRTELLYKGKIFDKKPETEYETNLIQMIYTGNLYSGRFGTIASLCEELDQINKNGKKIEIQIYSGTDLTEKQKNQLNKYEGVYFNGKVTESEVERLQNKADVLLHIEPFSLKGSLLCRLSFSTKLVDYFYKGKCIFAVGSSRCSAMKYLKRNDAAIIVTSLEDVKKNLVNLSTQPELMKVYATKAWECGYKNHQIELIHKGVIKDFRSLINESTTD